MSMQKVALRDIKSWSGETPDRFHAFYVRVTGRESLQKDLSIPNQIQRSHEIAALRGWTDYCIYVEPKNVSAELWTDKRPAMARLVDDLSAGRIIGVCARHHERLWRGTEIQTKLLTLMRANRASLWDFSGAIEFKSAHQRFTIQILGAASELEVKLTGERIREMKRGKAHQGKSGGGPPKFGYTSQSRRTLELKAAGCSEDEAYRQACLAMPVGRIWYIDERESEVVILIYRLYTAPEFGYGFMRIASYLNERGVKTRTGVPWQAPTVRKIISSPLYAGFTTFDEAAYADKVPSERPRDQQERFQGEHPPLVSLEVWERAQHVRQNENRVKRVRTGAKSNFVFSLSTVVRCPRCGSHMVSKWSSQSPRRYYMCGRRRQGGPKACDFALINATALQQEVWSWLHRLLSSPELVMEYVEKLRARLAGEVPEVAGRLAALERRQGEIRAAVKKYFTLIEQSDDRERDAMLVERVRELRAELQPVEAEVAELRTKMAPVASQRTIGVEQVRKYLQGLRTRVDERPELQRAIVLAFRRDHDLRVRAVSQHEFIVSIALRQEDFPAASERGSAVIDRLVTTAVTPRTAPRGQDGTGSP
jgi:site-specific DNA recombinase